MFGTPFSLSEITAVFHGPRTGNSQKYYFLDIVVYNILQLEIPLGHRKKMNQKKDGLVRVKMYKEVYYFFKDYFSKNGMSFESVLNYALLAWLALPWLHLR